MIGGLAAKKLGIKPNFSVKIDGPIDSFRFKWKKLTTSIKLSDELSGPSGGYFFPPGEDGERFANDLIEKLAEKTDREFMKGGGNG